MVDKNSRLADTEPLEEEEHDDAVIGSAFRWSLVVFLCLGVVAAVAGYVMTRPEPRAKTAKTKLALPEVRNKANIDIPNTPFVGVTRAAGVDFVHVNGAEGAKLLPETMGGGCAIFDFDNDLDQDLLFINSTHWDAAENKDRPRAVAALYRNDGGMKFTNVAKEMGLDVSLYGMGCAVGDFDNDGDKDVYITAVGRNRLFRNDGARFEEVTEKAGVGGDATDWSTSCGWFDYNNDGRLDLIVCNYVQWSREFDLAQDFRLIGVGRAYGPPTHFRGTFLRLYRNEGDGAFRDVSKEAGVQIRNRDNDVPAGKSLGVRPLDLEGDGWMDFIVANDTVQNFVFHNQKDGTFKEIGAGNGVGFDDEGRARGAMGIDAGDFRNNRTIGVAIGNFATEMTSLFVCEKRDLQFSDAAIATGLGPETRDALTFGLFFFDYDLDGRLDLLAANGHLEEEINRVQEKQFYAQPPQLFWNTGGQGASEFVKVPKEKCGADFVQPLVGRGAAFGDLDGDGDLDVLITSSGRAPRLLRNDQNSGNHWVRFRLTGAKCNRDAIGSRVELRIGDQTHERYVMPTRSYLSQSEATVTIGLGKAERIDEVTIHWADGSTQTVSDVKIDALNQVTQKAE